MKLAEEDFCPESEKPSDEDMERFHKYLDKIGLAVVQVKSPSNVVVSGIEISGKLLIVRATVTAFKKVTDATWVFKRVT